MTDAGKEYEDVDLSERHRWKHPHQKIRNPKFTYDKIYNKLTLTLSQSDTLTHFRPTDWRVDEYDSEGRTITKTEKPYWKDNPSLVMIEVKIRVRRAIDNHFNEQVVIRPQEYYAVADTIEHTLLRTKPDEVNYHDEVMKTAADLIYTPHRFRIFYGDYCDDPEADSEGTAIRDDLPQRTNALPFSKRIAQAILCRDGLRVKSYPQYREVTVYDSEGDSEGHTEIVEVPRYFCVMIPLTMKVKVKSVKSLFGGTPGVSDGVTYDATGLHFVEPGSKYADSEGNVYWDAVKNLKDIDSIVLGHQWLNEFDIPTEPLVVPKPGYHMGESWNFKSNYVIDPDGDFPENPMGEYICWYICSHQDIVPGIDYRFSGPYKYRENQRHPACYDFLIEFEEINKGE